jgi:hypothetical protein
MSYICCKGIYTRPCDDCRQQLCPTSGHGQFVSRYNFEKEASFLCFDCNRKRDYKKLEIKYAELLEENQKLREKNKELEEENKKLDIKEIFSSVSET